MKDRLDKKNLGSMLGRNRVFFKVVLDTEKSWFWFLPVYNWIVLPTTALSNKGETDLIREKGNYSLCKQFNGRPGRITTSWCLK